MPLLFPFFRFISGVESEFVQLLFPFCQPEDVEALAKEKGLTIGQKRLLIEFAAKLNPKREAAGDKRYDSLIEREWDCRGGGN